MLVLARGVGQKVAIHGGVIELTILSVQGSIVRLGFVAPREVSIQRFETLERTDPPFFGDR